VGKQLVVISGLERGRVLPLSDGDLIQLGCSQNLEILARFRDPEMARVHCEIQVQGDRVTIQDSDTPNGTFVNGKRIVRHDLQPADVIRIGKTELKFLCGDTFHPKPQTHSVIDLSDTQPKPPSTSEIPVEEPPGRLKAETGKMRVTAEHLNLLVGRTFAIHYKIGPVLGVGHWGRVFQARDLRVDKLVALKVLRPEFGEDQEAMQQFAVALKSVLPVKHPNLVTHLAAGRAGPFPWIAMEYVEGKSATQIIRRMRTTGMLDWRQTAGVAVHIARALDAAHQHQFRHGNITPQSILIREQDKNAKLGGLLLAKALEVVRREPTAGQEQNDDTPYMSPERTLSQTEIDIRSDIYSLGVVLYALVTSRPPFEGTNQGAIVQQIRTKEPIKPTKYQPLLHPLYEETILKMLGKEPADRPQTPAEVLASFEKIAKFAGLENVAQGSPG
jgi:serine/threonine protein kinase